MFDLAMFSDVETTGPEIWEQTQGRVNAWTVASGTGGTYAGVAQFLKSKNPNIKCMLADPPGSVLFNYFKNGKLEREGTGSITEGIGQGRVTSNMKVHSSSLQNIVNHRMSHLS
jgi:cysteine synthase